MELSVQKILEKTEGGLSFYKSVIKEPLVKKNDNCFKNVKSPFYPDKNPSVSIFKGNDNKYCFKDYGEMDHKGDVFAFAALHYKLDPRKDFGLILSKMNEDLKLGLIQGETSKNVEVKKRVKYDYGNNSYYELFERDNDEFNNEERLYLTQYGITVDGAKHFKMTPIDGYSFLSSNGERISICRKPDQVMFAYREDGFAKIYSPFPQKMFRYLGQKPSDYVFGKSHLTTMDCREDRVIITGGEKDVISLYAHGYSAICLNSETASLPEGLLDLLDLLYENVLVLYDGDPTGNNASISICKQNNLKRLSLPTEFISRGLGKDISDYFKVLNEPQLFSENKDIVGLELFENLIQEVIDGRVNFTEAVVEQTRIERSDVRTATQRLIDAKSIPPIKSLMGPFWHTNELAILFGDTGLGKSILAVNIADGLSKGSNVISLENQNTPLVTLYFDFELSDKQFQKRYTNVEGELYEFNDNFFIDNIDFVELAEQNAELSFDEMLYKKIADSINKIGAQVLIIDNITFLKSESSQDANVAMQIMSQLNKLKVNFGISILVLAHTPKRSPINGITISDLAGSKHLSNFSDSVFAIGKSAKDKNLRYLKQVKPSRSAECVYDSDNVLICELDKEDKGLFFEFVGLSKEQEHLSSDGRRAGVIDYLMPSPIDQQFKISGLG